MSLGSKIGFINVTKILVKVEKNKKGETGPDKKV